MGVVPIAFTDCNCKCEDPGPDRYFLVDSLSFGLKYDNEYQNGFDSTQYYPYNSIRLLICSSVLKQISSLQPDNNLFPFSFTSSAFACSCDEATYIIQNYITSIQIISKTDIHFNDRLEIKSGKSLNDYFKIQTGYPDTFYSINRYLSVFHKPWYNDQCLDLVLSAKPSQPVTIAFDIEIKLNDGKVFLFKNQQLKVK